MADLKLSAIFSAAEHASITSKSDYKVFEFSDKLQRCAVVCEGGNCRSSPADEDHEFCFVSVQLEPFETCSLRICSVGDADFQPCLKWEQCLSIPSWCWWSSITVKNLNWIQGSGSTSLYSQESVHVVIIKGVQKGTQRSALFQASVRRNLLIKFVAINDKAYASCVHGLNDISQTLWILNFCVTKTSLLEHCRRQQIGPEKQCTPSIFLFSSCKYVAKNKEGLVGVPCGAETKLWVWYLMFSKSPVSQQVPDHICKKSIDTAIDSQQTVLFWGRSWTFLMQRRNFDFVPTMWGDTPSDRNRWNKSVRRGSRTFSVCLLPRSSWIVFSACLMKEVENGSKLGLECSFRFEMFFRTVVARACMGGSSYTGAHSLLRWKVVFMLLYLPPGPGGIAMSEGETCPDRNWSLSNWCRVGKLDRPGSTSGTLSWSCSKCDWRCSAHDSAGMGETSY